MKPKELIYQLKLKGITQALLAKYFGCTKSYINNLIHSTRQNAKRTEIEDFATGEKVFPFEQVVEKPGHSPETSGEDNTINQNL